MYPPEQILQAAQRIQPVLSQLLDPAIANPMAAALQPLSPLRPPLPLGSFQLHWTVKSLVIPMALRDLIQSKRDEILALAAQYDAVNVRLFGSVARGDDRPDSDIDFLVDVQRQWSLFDHIGLIQDLEDLLGRKVDLIPADSIRDFCRDRILKDATPL
jgi:uncharacterized protein